MQRDGKPLLGLAGEAHLWLAPLTTDLDPSVLSSWWDLLSEEERERHGTLLLEEAKLRYMIAWALARTALSRYADVAPKDWRFCRGKHGRPEIIATDDAVTHDPPGAAHDTAVAVSAAPAETHVAPAAALPRLRFNLSHSGKLVACLVTLEVDVGVDVENTQRDLDMTRIADRFFSPEEAAEVRALSGGERRDRFFAYWTLKEAYLKACGRGMSIPLRQVSFRVAPDNTIGVRFDADLQDREDDWQFEVFRPFRNHLLAAAIRRDRSTGGGESPGSGKRPGGKRLSSGKSLGGGKSVGGADPHLSIVARQVVPLVEESEVRVLPVVASTPWRG